MIFDNNTTYQTYRTLVAIFGTLAMVVSTSPLRKNWKRNLLLVGAYAAYSVFFTLLAMRLGGFLLLLRCTPVAISLPGVVMCYLISDSSLPRHVFNCLSQLLLSLYLIISATLLNTLLGGSVFSSAFVLPLAYLALFFAEFFFLRGRFLRIAETITSGWSTLALIPSAFFILAMVLVLYPAHYTLNPSSAVLLYLLGAVILIIYYAIFKYLWRQYNRQLEEKNREILALQIQSMKKQANDAKRKAKEIRKAAQDTRLMLTHIAALAGQGNAEALLRYVAEVSAQERITPPAHYCADPILNATLTTYIDRAKSAGITVQLHLDIPDALPVDSAELGICFANALENAINACERLPKNERKIIAKCIHRPTFMFQIKNPYRGRISFGRDGLPQSARSGHGIGTRSIMAFCEKHNAFYSFSAEGGWFTLVVSL